MHSVQFAFITSITSKELKSGIEYNLKAGTLLLSGISINKSHLVCDYMEGLPICFGSFICLN